jgi:hypothetical protein
MVVRPASMPLNALTRQNTTTSSIRMRSTGNDVLDAYARGYEDGRSAAIREQRESRLGPVAQRPMSAASRVELQIREQEKQRGYRVGWNKAMEALQREGWTKGCAYCAPPMPRRPSVRSGSTAVRPVELWNGRAASRLSVDTAGRVQSRPSFDVTGRGV